MLRAFNALLIGLNATGTIGILFVMLLINADVGGRALLGSPIHGVPETVSLSIVAIVFLQAGYMLRSGRMIASDSLIERLRETAPRVARAIDTIFSLAGAALFGVLFAATLGPFQEAWRDDLFVGAQGDFTLPIWPVKLIVLVGSAAMSVQYLLFAFAAFRHARRVPAADL